MSHIQVLYLNGVGQYRRRWGTITSVWPKHLLNKPDTMAHSLEARPTVAKTTPVRFTSWRDFVDSAPPRPPVQVEHLQMLCEENSIWPVSPYPAEDPANLLKKTSMMLQEAAGNVKAVTARERYGNPLLNWAFCLIMAAGAVSVLMIVAIVAQIKFG